MGTQPPRMFEDFDEAYEALETVPAQVREAELLADEAQLIDLAGLLSRLGGNFGSLATKRRSIESELPAGHYGHRWQFTQGNKVQRSYNTTRLLGRFTHQWDKGLLFTLKQLLLEGAITITWHWSKLQAAARRADLALTTAPHEVEDGDPDVDVGEVWVRASARYEPIEEGEK